MYHSFLAVAGKSKTPRTDSWGLQVRGREEGLKAGKSCSYVAMGRPTTLTSSVVAMGRPTTLTSSFLYLWGAESVVYLWGAECDIINCLLMGA